jgi:hypothetical protein
MTKHQRRGKRSFVCADAHDDVAHQVRKPIGMYGTLWPSFGSSRLRSHGNQSRRSRPDGWCLRYGYGYKYFFLPLCASTIPPLFPPEGKVQQKQ